MKNNRKIGIALLAIVFGAMLLSSCDSFGGYSYEDSYNNGYMIGRGLAPLFNRE